MVAVSALGTPQSLDLSVISRISLLSRFLPYLFCKYCSPFRNSKIKAMLHNIHQVPCMTAPQTQSFCPLAIPGLDLQDYVTTSGLFSLDQYFDC